MMKEKMFNELKGMLMDKLTFSDLSKRLILFNDIATIINKGKNKQNSKKT